MKKILFMFFASLLVCGALYAQEAYGVRTTQGEGIGNTANTAVSRRAATGGRGSGFYGAPVNNDQDNFGGGPASLSAEEILDECIKNEDGKARGICLSRLHKDGKPIYEKMTMIDIAKGCEGIGSDMQSYDICASVHQTTANRMKQRNHIECCSWANLGVNTDARNACCGYMWKPKNACVLYYKGSCKGPNGGSMKNNRYNTFACNYVKDKDPWCGGEYEGEGEEPGGTGNNNDGTGTGSGPDNPTLADCKKITDGKARGLCLAKLPDLKEREAGCAGVGEHLAKYPSNCIAGSSKNNANIAYKENYLACCTYANLGANSGYRQRCCKAMPDLGCINYYKGNFQPAKGKYMSNACIVIPDGSI